MQIWRYVLAGSVVTAMAFIPQGQSTQKVKMPILEANPTFASLKLQKLTPTNILPARSPISFFSSKANKPLSGITICVDPGHGGQGTEPGYTGGTTGVITGQTEGDVNLRVALILRQYLQAAGANVVMTRIADQRCSDEGSCLREELDFRTNTAKRHRADFFVSVHHNEAGRNKPNTNYTAVFYRGSSKASAPLASNVSSAVSSLMGIKNAGAKVGDYRVLNQIDMPGIIVEASFMSCPAEDQKLANLSYNKLEARAIATGVLNYFRTNKGLEVDFNAIFAPFDGHSHSAQTVADASVVRRQVVERKSMFNKTYEEVTVDRSGKQIDRRPVGNSKLAAKKSSSPSKATATASPSPTVTKFVAASQKSAQELKSSNKSRVVLTERNKAIGASRPVVSGS